MGKIARVPAIVARARWYSRSFLATGCSKLTSLLTDGIGVPMAMVHFAARPVRLEFAGAIYHLTSRGNARQKVFFSDGDGELFLSTLAGVVSR
jgi:hypothetical protein